MSRFHASLNWYRYICTIFHYWDFLPLAFDVMGAPAPATVTFLHDTAKIIARRSSTPFHVCLRHIFQRTSFAIWSSVAQAVHLRNPAAQAADGFTDSA